jgi:hypothetical protein
MAVSIEEIIRLIDACDGNLAAIGRAINRDRTSVWERIQKSPEAKQALKDARESVGDKIENALITQALDGNVTAQIFYLKCQRGWRERTDIHVTGERFDYQSLSDEELEALASAESVG